MPLQNLLEQVVFQLVSHGKTQLDVRHVIGTTVATKDSYPHKREMSWEMFKLWATNRWHYYDIDVDITVVGDDWWIEVQTSDMGSYLVYREVPRRENSLEMLNTETKADVLRSIFRIDSPEGNLAEVLLEQREAEG